MESLINLLTNIDWKETLEGRIKILGGRILNLEGRILTLGVRALCLSIYPLISEY